MPTGRAGGAVGGVPTRKETTQPIRPSLGLVCWLKTEAGLRLRRAPETGTYIVLLVHGEFPTGLVSPGAFGGANGTYNKC
jgi:hypothetical protein